MVLGYDGGRLAVINISLRVDSPVKAIVVMSYGKAGKMESDAISSDETPSIMQTLDEIREHWGLRHASEE